MGAALSRFLNLGVCRQSQIVLTSSSSSSWQQWWEGGRRELQLQSANQSRLSSFNPRRILHPRQTTNRFRNEARNSQTHHIIHKPVKLWGRRIGSDRRTEKKSGKEIVPWRLLFVFFLLRRRPAGGEIEPSSARAAGRAPKSSSRSKPRERLVSVISIRGVRRSDEQARKWRWRQGKEESEATDARLKKNWLLISSH
jgi:hypothetical protein